MFKFKIDKEAIKILCEVMKNHSLSEIEVKNGSRSIKLSKNNNQNTIINTVKETQTNENEAKSNKKISKFCFLENTVKAPMLNFITPLS